MKYKKIIVHVPHTSLKLPKNFFNQIIIEKKELKSFNLFMCDRYVDKFIPLNIKKIKFKYSRIFCDVERFKDDNKEEMAKKGMGICYTKDNKHKKFINYDKDYKAKVISNYYDKHHNKLDDVSKNIVSKYGIAYIVDLHSFSDRQVKDLFDIEDTPDICLGIDNDFCDKKILKFTKNYFEDKGYTVKINFPYRGTLVPNYFYERKDKHIKSLMIEINKRLYLKENLKSIKNYNKIKRLIKKYFKELNKIINS